jgi:hypothetical protein
VKYRIWFAFTLASAVFCVLPDQAIAQTEVLVLASGPVELDTTSRALVCAANLGSKPVSGTIELLNATTGAVLLQHKVTLAAPGAGTPGDCISTGSDSTAVIAIIAVLIATVNPQPLPPSVVGSLQIVRPTSTAPANPQYVALTPLHPPQPCSQ